jgi:hypothetical protein
MTNFQFLIFHRFLKLKAFYLLLINKIGSINFEVLEIMRQRKLFIISELINYEPEKGRTIFVKRKSNHR